MKAIELFSRSSCPWCRSMCINESEVFFARSKVVKLWKTLYFSCDNCGSFFSKESTGLVGRQPRQSKTLHKTTETKLAALLRSMA